jgi:hypothetical protein
MNQIYKDLIETFITVGIPCIVGAVIAAAKHFIGAQKLARIANVVGAKGVLAQDAVKYAEDAFAELGGNEKLENAKKNLIGRLNQYGIGVTEDEADTLVRAAFQSVKGCFEANTTKAIAP